ncbi:MAG: fibronectin type III domain-containing protein [Bacteroidales bacterium]|nr:fibronectin type III domain-containing protein [Bacteroidales bacterium]
MRKFLLSLLLLVVFSPLALRADEVIVGTADGTSTLVVPFRNNQTASYTQSVYPKEEVGGAMTITAVAFSCGTPTQTTTSYVKVYIGETDLTYFTNSADWVTDEEGRTLVYEGSVTLGGEEWENFVFTAPYEYSGTKNLVIAVSASGTTQSMTLKWNTVTETSGTKPSIHNTQANSEPSGTTAVKSYRPIIKLTTTGNGGGETPENPEPEIPTLSVPVVTATAKNATQIELAWESVADSALYQVYFETENIGTTYNTSFIVNNCYPETQHCFTVTASKYGVTTDASEPACATTPAQGEEPTPDPEPEPDPEPTPDPEVPGSTSVAFFDDFNDFKYTERWSRIDKDGDGYNWSSTQYGNYAGYDTYGLYSACYMSGQSLTPDNYIYTNDKYIITETSALSFIHCISDWEFYEETFSVIISEDGENFETVWTKKYTENDVPAGTEWNYDSISLASYVGKTVHIGFRHHDSNGNIANGIRIDNVRLSTADDNGEDEEPENPTPDFPTGDAETVVIGEGGTASSFYVPINDYYNSFGISQMIYTDEEMGVKDGSIINMSFKSDVVGNTEREIAVYLKNTDKEYFTTESDWIVLTEEDVAVFEGTIVTPSSSGWFTISFTRPFEYTGGNLAVTINDITGGYEYGDSWCSYVTENPRAIYSTSYNTPIDHLELESRFGSYDKIYGTSQYINSQIKFDIVPAQANVEVPETIALGDVVLGEYWSEKVVKANVKAVNTTITNITVDNNFFVLPAEIDYTAANIELAISYDRNAAAGEYAGNLLIAYADTTKVVPMTANAYNAAAPDVFELAQKVEFTGNAFTHTPAFANLHDNYLLPEEKEDGNAPDAVYEVELTNDALVTASVSGTNSMLAVYKSDFNGEGGPSARNYYEGISYTSRSFNFDFNNGSLNGWTLIDNDGDGYNWEIVNEDGAKYAKSFAHKKQGEGEQEVTIITEADNVMMTEQVYNITANSKLSFDASRYSSGNVDWDNSETYKEYVFVAVTRDGQTFTTIEKTLPTAGVFGNIVVDLGAKFAELGLNYGEYHVALQHKEKDGVYVSVDNIKLANVIASKAKSVEGVHYPAGKYYFVAAAESAFTVNISIEEAPLTPPTEIFTTEVTETTVTLAWDAVSKAEKYNVYNGGTFVASVAETTCKVEGLAPYTEYSFVIKSVVGEEESFASEAVVVRTSDLVVGVPTNLTAQTTGSSTVVLTWTAAENALAYNIYEIVTGSAVKIGTANTTTYTVTDLAPNTPYFFAVTSVRNEQESERTVTVSAITYDLVPGAPSNLVATTMDITTIGLTWEAGENATGYNIYRDGSLVGNSTGLLYVDRDLVQGTQYCYTVKSVRGTVESEESSNQACATTDGTKPVPPVAPKNLTVVPASTTSVKLVWGAVGNATSYNVYQGEEKIATTELPSYTVENLNADTEYCFTVTAVNEVGESEKSAEACGKTKADGIDELTTSLNIYPNPVSDKLYIEAEVEIEEVVVYDVYGRHQVAEAPSRQGNLSVDVSNLNSGVYFVKVITENGEVVKRFIKK